MHVAIVHSSSAYDLPTLSVIYRFIPRHGRTSKASIAIRETRPSFSAGRTHTSTTVPVTGTACMSPLSSYNHFIPLKKQIFLAPDLKLDLVDSTRAGERLPDAPSKTVPICCATNNRATQLCGSLKLGPRLRRRRTSRWRWISISTWTRTARGSRSQARLNRRAARQLGHGSHRVTCCHLPPYPFSSPPSLLPQLARTHTQDSSFYLPEGLNRPSHCARCDYAPVVAVAPEAPSFMPVICVSASRAVGGGTSTAWGDSHARVRRQL